MDGSHAQHHNIYKLGGNFLEEDCPVGHDQIGESEKLVDYRDKARSRIRSMDSCLKSCGRASGDAYTLCLNESAAHLQTELSYHSATPFSLGSKHYC